MRIGILGGSFDPIHYGHLLLAETGREALQLDRVWFIPAAAPPHKSHSALTPAPQRLEMLQLAIADHPAFEIRTTEIDRGGMSYTVETLEALLREVREAELYLIVGADSLYDLPSWHQPQRICELAVVACAARPNAPPLDFTRLAPLVTPERLELFRSASIAMPQMDLSSSELRRRTKAGQSIRYRTPRSVECYIATHGLYQHPEDRSTAP